jgi:hypothetical protein
MSTFEMIEQLRARGKLDELGKLQAELAELRAENETLESSPSIFTFSARNGLQLLLMWLVCSIVSKNTNVAAFECQDATEATTSSTGSIKTAGGIGIAKKLNVGGDSKFAATVTFAGDTDFSAGTCTGCGTPMFSGTHGVTSKYISNMEFEFTNGASEWSAGQMYLCAGTLTDAQKTFGGVVRTPSAQWGCAGVPYGTLVGGQGTDRAYSIYCFVSTAGYVKVVLSIGGADITKGCGDTPCIDTTVPMNIVLFPAVDLF